MTVYNRTSLKTFFEQGDIPTGTNYSDLIDSCLNLAETGVQTISGPINPTEVITARISAGTGIFTGDVRISGTLSAGTFSFQNITADAITISTNVTAGGTVYASAVRSPGGVYTGVGIISAAGTTQATAALLTFNINRGAGVADGATTGFSIPANMIGLTQTIINGGASANLWPPTGGRINALSSNAAFGMAANTPYIIYHIEASGYAVK